MSKPLDPEWEPLWKDNDTSGELIRKRWAVMAGFVGSAHRLGLGPDMDAMHKLQAEQMRREQVLIHALCELADRHPREMNAILMSWYRPLEKP